MKKYKLHFTTNRDKDYSNYNTPNNSKIDETTFTLPGPIEKQATSTLWLRQKVKQDKLAALYRHLNVTGDLRFD